MLRFPSEYPSGRVYHVITRYIHEYISHITRGSKYVREMLLPGRAFLEYGLGKGDRPVGLFGVSRSCKRMHLGEKSAA